MRPSASHAQIVFVSHAILDMLFLIKYLYHTCILIVVCILNFNVYLFSFMSQLKGLCKWIFKSI